MSKIRRRRGDTFAHRIAVTDEDTGEPVDITGFTFKMTVDPEQAPADGANNIWQVAGAIVDAPAGVVGFSPDAGEADNVGDFFYDIEMTNTLSKSETIDAGPFELIQDISK
jgi:hypothetical protein